MLKKQQVFLWLQFYYKAVIFQWCFASYGTHKLITTVLWHTKNYTVCRSGRNRYKKNTTTPLLILYYCCHIFCFYIGHEFHKTLLSGSFKVSFFKFLVDFKKRKERREREERNIDLLFHLFMRSLVSSCTCLMGHRTHNLGVSGWCSNHRVSIY